jgi:hypothetical protein
MIGNTNACPHTPNTPTHAHTHPHTPKPSSKKFYNIFWLCWQFFDNFLCLCLQFLRLFRQLCLKFLWLFRWLCLQFLQLFRWLFIALLTIFYSFLDNFLCFFCFAFYAVQILSPQYKSLITFFRGGGVKVFPRTALLLSKTLHG